MWQLEYAKGVIPAYPRYTIRNPFLMERGSGWIPAFAGMTSYK